MNKSISNFSFIILCTVMLIYTAMKKTSRSIHSTTRTVQIHLQLLWLTRASRQALTLLLHDQGSPEILFSHFNISLPCEACAKSCLVSLYIVQYQDTRKSFTAQTTEIWRLQCFALSSISTVFSTLPRFCINCFKIQAQY